MKVVSRLCLAFIFCAFSVAVGAAEYTWEKVLQSPVDQTFFGFDDPRNVFDPDNLDIHPVTVDGVTGKPKRNGGYMWGSASYKDEIWYGINDNGWCDWVGVASVPSFSAPALGNYGKEENIVLHTYETEVAACSHDPNENQKPFTRFYYFNTKTKKLTRVNSDNPKFLKHAQETLAIRSAGRYGNVIFLAGLRAETFYLNTPELAIFAFNADTHEYIDSTVLKGFSNIRRMGVLPHPDGTDAMYVSVGNDGTSVTGKENYLLRWAGTTEVPFEGKGGNGNRPYLREQLNLKGTNCNDAAFDTKKQEWNATYSQPNLQGEFVRIDDTGSCSDEGGRTIKLILNEVIDGFNVAIANYGEETGLYSEIDTYTANDGNMYVVTTTWNSTSGKAGGLYISDPLPSNGFASVGSNGMPSPNGKFNKIMLLSEFEPETNLHAQLLTGFLSVYKGYAYWGTMTTPTLYALSVGIAMAYNGIFGNLDANGEVIDHNKSLCTGSVSKTRACITNMIRSAQVFRTKLGGVTSSTPTAADTELLYGDEYFTVMDMSWADPSTPSLMGIQWKRERNKLGMVPKYGPAGITSRSNNYAWVSTVFNDKLYFGTMDISNGMRDYLESDRYKNYYSKDTFVLNGKTYKGWNPETEDVMPIQAIYDYFKERTIQDGSQLQDGGDLLVFEDENSPAKLIGGDGLGNPRLTGFRNFEVVNDELYLGTTSMANIGNDAGYSIYKLSVHENGLPSSGDSSSGGCAIGGQANSNIPGVLIALGIIVTFMICYRRFKTIKEKK